LAEVEIGFEEKGHFRGKSHQKGQMRYLPKAMRILKGIMLNPQYPPYLVIKHDFLVKTI
jgi:hypothetical protein